MEAKLSKIYYSPQGYWKGLAAVKKLSTVAKFSEEVAKKWLVKQALWQIHLPAPRYIPRPKFDVSLPNAGHQADLLFLPHDKLPHGRKIYKYALTVVDVASRYKAAEPLTSKESDEVSKAFQKMYKRGPLKWPQLLQVDPGREFMGAVTKVMQNNKIVPLVPRKPLLFVVFKVLFQFWLYCFIQSVVRKREVHAVCVHLDQLVVMPSYVLVQEVVVEL